MLRGSKNGEPLGIRNDLECGIDIPYGALGDVRRACHRWLMERDIRYSDDYNRRANYITNKKNKTSKLTTQ